MILLDTHAFVWFIDNDDKLPSKLRQKIIDAKKSGLGVSVISVWEIALLVALNRIDLKIPVDEWVSKALKLSYIELLPLTAEIAIESTRLPQPFHKDPADRILVATSRMLHLPITTIDRRIVDYAHVKKV